MATGGDKGPSLADLANMVGLHFPGPEQAGRAPTQAGATIASWVERLLAPHLQSLGQLGTLLPGVLSRAAQVIESPAGDAVLFRVRSAYDPTKATTAVQSKRELSALCRWAAERKLSGAEIAFYKFVASIGGATDGATPALAKQLGAIKAKRVFENAFSELDELTADKRRQDLPLRLDQLKHAVRADRAQGFMVVHAALKWLLKSDSGKEFAAAYALLEELTDALGETCLRRVRRHPGALNRLFAAALIDEGGRQALHECFASFGFRLGERLAVLRCGSELRPELLVMDHDHDRCFEVRQGEGSTEGQPWSGAEIVGAEAGRDYPFDQQINKLPLRVHDAAQGLALWSVDRRLVQESPELNSQVGGVALRAWDTGTNRTPVAVFFAHFRDTDIGEYYEIGLACFAAPTKDPLSVGVVTLGSMPVSFEPAQQFGLHTWGYPKEYVPKERWKVLYRPEHLECKIEFGADATLTFRLPRGGAASSSAVPVLLYTRKPKEGGLWHRSAMMRFARGESVRIAGSGVELAIEFKNKDAALRHPLLGELYRLGLVDPGGRMRSRAMLAAWSENVSAHLGAGLPLQPPERQFD